MPETGHESVVTTPVAPLLGPIPGHAHPVEVYT